MKAFNYTDKEYIKLTDYEVVRRIKTGEKELFELLMRRNNQMLFRVIKGYISDTDLIADVMQNTYLKAYEKLSQFKNRSRFSTWLIRIGINESLQELKKRGKYITIREEDKLENSKVRNLPNTERLNPESKMIQYEMKLLLENCINRLEPKYRIVYIMREVEELSLMEISNCLDISLANVKVRLHRSRKMLRNLLFETSTAKDVFEFGSTRCDLLVENVLKKLL